MKLNDRHVIDYTVEGDLDDALFMEAYYEDTGEALTEVELDLLGDTYPEVLNEAMWQVIVGRAEAIADAYKDGTY